MYRTLQVSICGYLVVQLKNNIMAKQTFYLKTFSQPLYKWSPEPKTITKRPKENKPYYCSAVAGSQGEDWVSTYCYNITVINGVQSRLAYVACDYVE